jgi:hypothetical protein
MRKRQPQPSPQPEIDEYAEVKIPFDDVLRQLVNTKPAHKTAKPFQQKVKPAKS